MWQWISIHLLPNEELWDSVCSQLSGCLRLAAQICHISWRYLVSDDQWQLLSRWSFLVSQDLNEWVFLKLWEYSLISWIPILLFIPLSLSAPLHHVTATNVNFNSNTTLITPILHFTLISNSFSSTSHVAMKNHPLCERLIRSVTVFLALQSRWIPHINWEWSGCDISIYSMRWSPRFGVKIKIISFSNRDEQSNDNPVLAVVPNLELGNTNWIKGTWWKFFNLSWTRLIHGQNDQAKLNIIS